MTQIATRWVDKNIDVISKRMSNSSRQGLELILAIMLLIQLKLLE